MPIKSVRPKFTKDLWKVLFYFSFSSLIPLIYIRFFFRVREETFLFVFLNALIFMLPLLLGKIKSRLYVWTMGAVIFLFSLVNLFYALVFKSRMDKHIYYVIFDTNIAETSEFLGDFLNPLTILIISSYILLFLFLSIFLFKDKKIKTVKSYPVLILFVLMPLLVKLMDFKGDYTKVLNTYSRANNVLAAGISYYKYTDHIRIIESAYAGINNVPIETKRELITNRPETHVFILGEALTTTHMSLYGYNRKTNPKLESIKDELIIFDHVQCTKPPVTDINVQRMLTLKKFGDDRAELLKTSIINIMKESGFKTYWLSNQGAIALHVTIITALGNSSDKKSYTSSGNKFNLDNRIFPVLDRYLAEKEKKKFIIIHINGAHNTYSHRYPENFNKWTNPNDTPYQRPFHNKKKRALINEYDNAVLYNDHIIYSIIKKLKKLKGLVSMTYIPDHGEEVFMDLDRMGHGGMIPSKSLYSVPMIMWMNQAYKEERVFDYDLETIVSRPYTSDHLIHTFMDLYKIKSKAYEPQNSILNKKYTEKRIYKN